MRQNIIGITGMSAAAVPLISIMAAISMSPWFSWTGKFLSDLGREGVSASIFNGGIAAGGVLASIFCYMVFRKGVYKSRYGMAAFFVATVSLVGVGAFPVYTDMIHTAFAVSFFLSSTAALLLIGYAERRSDGRLGTIIMILGLVSLAALPLYGIPRPFGFNAFVEMLTSAAMSAFTAITALTVIKKG